MAGALLLGAVSAALGLWSGRAWLLPGLEVAAGYPLMILLLRADRRALAIAAMLAWAAGISLAVILGVASAPATSGPAVLRGPAYWSEMSAWIQSGAGCESAPGCWVPQHLFHLVLFTIAGLASAGLAALGMGAVLMNYMSYYVGQLVARSDAPLLALLAGWHPWAVCRVIGFVILGVLSTQPLLGRFDRAMCPRSDQRALLALALGLIALDGLLKWTLAPGWAELLRGLVTLP
jgi:hypothetical protein